MKAQIQNPLLIVSEIQISYQPNLKVCDRPKISRSQDAYGILYHNWDQGRIELHEQFYILLLNRAHRVVGMVEISIGGFAGTVVDPKLVFAMALKCCASGIILAHNHPSGNLQLSSSDIEITKKMVEIGKLLDLQILDHIIPTKENYLSFGDEGLI